MALIKLLCCAKISDKLVIIKKMVRVMSKQDIGKSEVCVRVDNI